MNIHSNSNVVFWKSVIIILLVKLRPRIKWRVSSARSQDKGGWTVAGVHGGDRAAATQQQGELTHHISLCTENKWLRIIIETIESYKK